MKEILVSVIVLLAAALVCGCASYKQFDPNVLIDGEPALVMEASFGGAGSVKVTTEGAKTIVEMEQKGMTDIAGKTISGTIEAAAGVFGGNPAPPSITIMNVTGQDRANGQGNTDAEVDR